MAPCKAIILVGALLLVITLQNRIHPSAGDRAMKEVTKQMSEQDQEELAEAPAEEEDAAADPEFPLAAWLARLDEAGATSGDAFAGPEFPRDPNAKTVAAFAVAQVPKQSAAVGEHAMDEAEPTFETEPRAELIAEDEQAAATHKDMERTLKGIHPGKKKPGKEKKGKGSSRDKATDKGKDDGKEKGNKLVKGNGKAKGKLTSKDGQRPIRRFRFPLLNGRWWITRLSFLRERFVGFIYQENSASKTLLIKSLKAQEEFGDEAIIPRWGNYAGAKVGDKITFDVDSFAQEREGKPRPVAKHVIIRERGHDIGAGLVLGPALTNVCTQVLYYISDENLRTDKFFHDIIATTGGGWISTSFLLPCRRMKQLGASTKSIIDCLRDAPGVEVRDIPGQEAVRRTSPPPPLEPGAIVKRSAVACAEAPALAKTTYSKVMIKRVGNSALGITVEKSWNHVRAMLKTMSDLALFGTTPPASPFIAPQSGKFAIVEQNLPRQRDQQDDKHQLAVALRLWKVQQDQEELAKAMGSEANEHKEHVPAMSEEDSSDSSEDLSKATGSQANEHKERAPAMSEADSSDTSEEQKDGPTERNHSPSSDSQPETSEEHKDGPTERISRTSTGETGSTASLPVLPVAGQARYMSLW